MVTGSPRAAPVPVAEPDHATQPSEAMSRFLSVLIVLFLLVVGGGMAVLATWDMPVPSKTVEKVLPDERFPR